MAVAGSGGWVPSCTVLVRDGGLVAHGIVNNKPADSVYSDTERGARGTLADAIAVLRRDTPVYVDMSNGQFMQLVELWKNRQ